LSVDLGSLELANIPRDESGPVFREPWEAQAFALVVELQAHRLFTWSEWAEALGTEIRKAQYAGDPDLGDSYYRHWLAALERIVVETGLTDESMLLAIKDAWDRAAKATPHGQSILLDGRER
jgi:nitrile hydratase accessory protein